MTRVSRHPNPGPGLPRPNARIRFLAFPRRLEEPGRKPPCPERGSSRPMKSEPSGVADLTVCDQELIHIPGSIQPLGLLLALSVPDLRVTHASRNVDEWLGRAADDLIGVGLGDVLGFEIDRTLRACLPNVVAGRAPLSVARAALGVAGRARTFDVIVHRADDSLILELEPVPPDPAGEPSSRDIEWLSRDMLVR